MNFGAHVSSAGGAFKAAERAAAIGCDAVQIFTQSPRMWRSKHPDEQLAAQFRAACEEHGIVASVSHAPYLINLGTDRDDLYDKSCDALEAGLRAGDALGLDGVVVHVGSHQGRGLDAAMPGIVGAIERVLAASETTWLLLENSAGAGDTIGRSVDELSAIFEAAGSPDRLGICLDTCHWWVSGVNITDRAVLDAELEGIEAAIGLDRLRAVHVNDAKTDFDSNRDRHANLGDGTIGDDLRVFLQHPAIRDLPAYLEVPGDGDGPTAEQVARLRALAGT